VKLALGEGIYHWKELRRRRPLDFEANLAREAHRALERKVGGVVHRSFESDAKLPTSETRCQSCGVSERTNLAIHRHNDTEFSRSLFCAIDFAKSRHKRPNIAVIRQVFVDNCVNDLISLQGLNLCIGGT
jgi:hypothetical protein